MHSSRRFRRFATVRPTVAPTTTTTASPREKPGAPFYIMLGIACALGVLTIIGTALLFLHESRESEVRPAEAAVAPAPGPVDGTATVDGTAAALPAESDPGPEVKRPPATRVARAPKRAVEKKEFRGTVWPPLEQKVAQAPPVEVEVAAEPATEPADEPQPIAAAKAVEPEAAAAAAPEAVSVDGRNSGKVRRAFGAILRPFRGRKPTTEQ